MWLARDETARSPLQSFLCSDTMIDQFAAFVKEMGHQVKVGQVMCAFSASPILPFQLALSCLSPFTEKPGHCRVARRTHVRL